jgi:hypothetical protein
MKKYVLLVLIMAVVFSAYAKEKSTVNVAYECPELDVKNSYFIDLNDFKTSSINSVEILFNANNKNSIKVFGNNPDLKNWEELASIELRGFSDKKKKSFTNKNAASWRYFGIAPESGRQYIYKISFSGKTLKCEIREKNNSFNEEAKPGIDLPGAYTFSIWDYGAEDYVVLRNYTSNEKLVVVPYYFDDSKYVWVKGYEAGILRGYNDSSKVEIIDDEGIEDIKYLALVLEPDGEYTFNLLENHSDLYIDISDKRSVEIEF